MEETAAFSSRLLSAQQKGGLNKQQSAVSYRAHGIEDSVFTIASLAMATGAHVRVGFEDRATLVDGSLAESSADFVSWAVNVARAHGREPATPQEARQMLGLPQK